jgi:hypothetical protein
VYEYFTGGANDEFNPEGRFDQVVHFREPVSSLDWLYVASSESPDPPYLVETGKSEAPLGRAVAFVPQSQQCPPSYPGGAGAMSFGGTTDPTFTDFGEVNVPVGFWRACGYLINGSTSSLGAQSTFSQAPKGGWKPKYSLAKGSLKVKSGKLALGSASCPAACTITMVAKSGKTTLAKGTASGNGKIKLKLKATSAGRKAAKKGVKAKFTLTSMIELSEVTQTATLKLK